MNKPPDYQLCIDEAQDFLDEVNMRKFYQEFCFGDAECRIDPDAVYAANMEIGLEKEQEKASNPPVEQNIIEKLYIPTKKSKKRPPRKKNKTTAATNTPKKDENQPEIQNEMSGEQTTEVNQSNTTEGSKADDNTPAVLHEESLPEEGKDLAKNNTTTENHVITSTAEESTHSTKEKLKTLDVQITPKKQGKKPLDCKTTTKAGTANEKCRLVKDMPEICVDDLDECYTKALSGQKKAGKGMYAQEKTCNEKNKQEYKTEAKCTPTDSKADESTDTQMMKEVIDGFRNIKQKWRDYDDEAEKKNILTSRHNVKESLKILTKFQGKPEDKTTFYGIPIKHDGKKQNKGDNMPENSGSTPYNQLFTFGNTEQNTSQKPKPCSELAGSKLSEKIKMKIVKPVLKKTDGKTEPEATHKKMNMENSHPNGSLKYTLDKSEQKKMQSMPKSDSRVQLTETKSKNTVVKTMEKQSKLTETKKPKTPDPKINGASRGNSEKTKEVRNAVRDGKHINTVTRSTNTTSPAIVAVDKCQQKISTPTALEELQRTRAKLFEVKPKPIKKENFAKNNEIRSPLKEAKTINVTTAASKCSSMLTTETAKHELPTTKPAEPESKTSEADTEFNRNVVIENILKKNPFSIDKKTNLKGGSESTPVHKADRTMRKPFMKAIKKQKACKEIESLPDKSKVSKIPIRENPFKIGDTSKLSTAFQTKELDDPNCSQNDGSSEMKCTESSKHSKNNEESKTGFWKRVGDFFKAKK